jgi:hypothetical protein
MVVGKHLGNAYVNEICVPWLSITQLNLGQSTAWHPQIFYSKIVQQSVIFYSTAIVHRSSGIKY